MHADASFGSPATGIESEFNIKELLRAGAYAHPVSSPTLHETNISWVILTGPFAYKIKKRVALDFLNTSTLAHRKFLCEEEMRLNRRLAADLYLAVVAVTQDAGGMHMDGPGEVVDYAVKMRQFPVTDELTALLARGDVTMAEITRLADCLADFHGNAKRAPQTASCDYPHELRDAVCGTLATLVAHLDPTQNVPALGLVIDWIHDSLHQFGALFRQRQSDGFIRECHGDLHAHNIVRWNDKLTPFDCLEFDPKLRFIDVANDIAFLVMDLVAHERNDLAYGFLSRYTERTGDYAGLRLLPFYAVYRALVRAMVDALGAERQAARYQELHRRLHLRINTAVEFVQPKRPTLVIMHGLSGSGKSWLSERLIGLVGAVRIRSDLERTRGGHGASSDGPDAYSRGANERTYAKLLQSAEGALLAGMNVIVDASFLDVDNRRQFQDLAGRLDAVFVIVSCKANRAEMTRRLVNRQRLHADPSEADAAVLEFQFQHFRPLSIGELPDAIQVDTTLPDAAKAAFATLQAREVNLARPATAWRASGSPTDYR